MQPLEAPAGPGSGEPFLSVADGGVVLSWLEESGDDAHDLRFATLRDGTWSEALTVERSDRFFVNWADFPSVTPAEDGTLWAHWLERGPTGGYDYGIRVVHSADGGHSWSEPWKPHEDDTPTEHGFVSVLPFDGGVGLTWLDGRETVGGTDGTSAAHGMTLRFRMAGAPDGPGPETLLDGRVCDCCQTDAALTSEGPVVVYRDRTDDEIRDIYVTRRVADGWTEGVPVHHDGWEIGGCPVNGPAVAARGRSVGVVWFTGAQDVARAKVAFSDDGGSTFGAPQVVDDGNPIGRVDILFLDEERALVSWLEQTGTEQAAVRVREVRPGAEPGPAVTVVESSSARASGFPRMALDADGTVVVAWTDVSGDRSQVRVARLEWTGSNPR
jgi:hypothetical protein